MSILHRTPFYSAFLALSLFLSSSSLLATTHQANTTIIDSGTIVKDSILGYKIEPDRVLAGFHDRWFSSEERIRGYIVLRIPALPDHYQDIEYAELQGFLTQIGDVKSHGNGLNLMLLERYSLWKARTVADKFARIGETAGRLCGWNMLLGSVAGKRCAGDLDNFRALFAFGGEYVFGFREDPESLDSTNGDDSSGAEWKSPRISAHYTMKTNLRVSSSGVSGVAVTSPTSSTYSGITNYSKSAIPFGTNITLTAPPSKGSAAFTSWSNCNSTSGRNCTVTMYSDRSVTANYTTPTYTLSVRSAGASGVAVTSSTSSTYSGTTNYSRSVPAGTTITLTAPSSKGSAAFTSWSNCNSTSGRNCTVTISANKTVTANYTTPTYTLSVRSSGLFDVTITNRPLSNVRSQPGHRGYSGSADGGRNRQPPWAMRTGAPAPALPSP